MWSEQRCLFCGGDASAPDHLDRCDGRQGRRESLYGVQGDVPYETTSATSAAAAGSITDSELSRLEALVFDVLKAAPRTCDAVELVTGLSHQTTSARVRGLVLRARIVDSGIRARTRTGRWATIWRIAQDQ
jgi:hypothetical protein